MDALTAGSVLSFFSSHSHHLYRTGEAIIRVGETPGGIFYLARGLVRQYSYSPKGEMILIHVFRPGSFFPMMWAFTGLPNTYQYEAVSSVEVYRAPKEEVLGFFSRYPEELWAFTRRVVTGLAGLVFRMEYVMFGGSYRKTVLLLAYFTKTFGEKEGKQIVIPMNLAHREIAAWVGCTRETVSVQMERLRQKGLIATRGRTLVIKNLAALEKEGE